MHLGRYGSIAGVCLGLVAAGGGMIWPNDPRIGWALIAIGAFVFVVSSVWGLVDSYLRTRTRREKIVGDAASIGEITIKAGDSNRFGNIGHKIFGGRNDR